MKVSDLSLDEQIAYLFRGSALDENLRVRMEAEIRELLQLGRPLRVKLGLDPSKPFLHLGHLAPLMALKRFADLGHHTYILLGGFTAMIGDPSGRKYKRDPLTQIEVSQNAEIYIRQIFQVLERKETIVVNNATWFEGFRLQTFMLKASKVTLAKMLEHGDFKDRFESHKEIGLQELLYPLAQSIDSMVMCAAPAGREDDPDAYVDALGNPNSCCDVEVGGNDQLFNFTLTRSMMDAHGLRPESFIVMPLIIGADKQKMGKGDDRPNVIRFLDEPSIIYKAIMKDWDDDLIVNYLAILTSVPDQEINEISQNLRNNKISKVEAKKRLAREVLTTLHGIEKAQQAQGEFEDRLSGRVKPERDFTVPVELASGQVLVADLAFASGLAESKNEAWRLVEQGGISLDGQRVNIGQKVEVKDGMILQRGQRRDAIAVRLHCAR